MLLILLGVIVGIILPVQTSINARLQKTVGSPFIVSLITFTVGTIFLAIVTLIQIKTLLVPLTLIESQPFWIWIGGLLGVFYLTTNILLFPKLGSIQTVIMPILGQILMGLVIDQFGLFYSMESKMTVVKFLGAMFVVAGVLVAIVLKSMLEHQVSYTQKSKGLNLWRLIGLIAGMLSATESAINGRLEVVLKSSEQASFISFLVGAIALLIIVLILRPNLQQIKSSQNSVWWSWSGGIIGAFFVLGNVFLVPILGTGLTVIIVIVGMMIGGIIIDQFGLFGSPKKPTTLIQILGLAMMIVGVVMIKL